MANYSIEDIKKRMEKDALLFGKIVSPQMFSVPSSIFHYELRDIYHSDAKKIVIEAPRGHGKEIADSTPVLTTNGWKTHGELRPGDYVYHPSGKPIRVLAESEKHVDDYVVTLRNGEQIRCHANHEWKVWDRAGSTRGWRIMETHQLVGNWENKRSRFLLPGINTPEYFREDASSELIKEHSHIGILKVEYSPNGETGKCIQVDADDGMYLVGRKLIPTHNSSLVGGIFVLHHLMFEKRVPHKVVLLISKTEGHAKRLLQTIADILEYSKNFRAIFGYWGQQSARRWTTQEIELKDGSLITCRGAGQHIVGLKHLNQRPTLAVLDDPEDLNNTKTKAAMDHNLKILLKEIIPGLDPRYGRVFVIGTPQRQGCLVETLLDSPGWVSKKYDAIVDEEKHLTLWPEWWSWDRLMQEKASLEAMNKLSIFYSEYRCQLIGDEEQIFKPEYMQYWDGEFFRKDGYAYLKIRKKGSAIQRGLDYVPEYEEYDEPKVIPVNIFMGIDPASSVQKSADYSVIMPIAVDAEKNIYILPYFRGRVTPMRLAQEIISYYRTYKPEWTNIETVGYQEMLRDYLRHNEEVGYIPGLEFKNQPKTSKSARLESMEIDFYRRKVYIQENMQSLLDELFTYPRNKNDDTLDALYYARKKIWIPSHEYQEKQQFFKKKKKKFKKSWLIA